MVWIRENDDSQDARITALEEGGGSGGLSVTTVTLLDADIKALPTTPFQVLPPAGEGKMYFPISALFVADCTAGAYTNIDAASGMYLSHEFPQSATAILVELAGNDGGGQLENLIGVSEKSVGWMTQVQGAASLGFSSGSELASAYENAPLLLGIDLSPQLTPYEDGNAANTLAVTVVYAIIDL